MKRKKNFCCTLLIIVLILSIGIGYAYLSSELNFTLSTASISPYVRLCKRAKTLHSITCTSSSTEGYCKAEKRKDSITFGQIGTSGKLTSGDAFDCDVNGDGTYDAATERFYYVTDLNSTTAILLFYTTTSSDGKRSVGVRPPYDSSGVNYNGPVTAASVLPTKTAWPKATLYNNPAQIYNYEGGTTVEYSGTHTLPKYKYTTAARLLTYSEYLKLPKDIFWEDFGGTSGQYFPNCLWLNTPYQTSPQVFVIHAPYQLNISTYPSTPNNSCGVRPVIEVKKEDMLY